jgi:hypothetical protein
MAVLKRGLRWGTGGRRVLGMEGLTLLMVLCRCGVGGGARLALIGTPAALFEARLLVPVGAAESCGVVDGEGDRGRSAEEPLALASDIVSFALWFVPEVVASSSSDVRSFSVMVRMCGIAERVSCRVAMMSYTSLSVFLGTQHTQ